MSATANPIRRLPGYGMAHAPGLCLALFLLNSALTFHNRWPTVGVRWVPELSVDLAALLLALVFVATWRDVSGRGWRNAVLGLVIVLVLGRYLDVTAPALMGRSINLYWDSPHIPAVAALFLDRVTGWQALLGGSALLALLAALFAVLRWAVGAVMTALVRASARRTLGMLALTLLALYGAGRLSPRLPTEYAFSLPVTPMLAGQVQAVLTATVLRDHSWIAAQPPLPVSDLKRLEPGRRVRDFFRVAGRAGVRRTPFRRSARRRFRCPGAVLDRCRLAGGFGASRIQHFRRPVLAGAFQPAVRIAHRRSG